jgi:hypothetical protein
VLRGTVGERVRGIWRRRTLLRPREFERLPAAESHGQSFVRTCAKLACFGLVRGKGIIVSYLASSRLAVSSRAIVKAFDGSTADNLRSSRSQTRFLA